jgi:hypothetical protein
MVLTFRSPCGTTGGVVTSMRVLTAIHLTYAPGMDSALTDPVFQQAYEAVRRSYSDEAWHALTPRQITEAIYLEIRRIDAIAARQNTPPCDPSSRDER